jgi:tight adherence protein B
MRREPRGSHAPSIEDVATTLDRLAVLIAAGVAPGVAWHHVALRAGSSVVTAAAFAASEGRSIAAAITHASDGLDARLGEAWRSAAAAWGVAVECGAPLAASLRELAAVYRAVGHNQRELEAAWAGPRATVRLVAALPAVGVVFGLLMGFDTLRVLFASPPGWLCLLLGGALMFAGGRWNRRLMAAARPARSAPGIGIDLMTIALEGGCSIGRARSIVREQLRRNGLDPSHEDESLVSDVLALAEAAGAPVSDLLRGEAVLLRNRVRVEGRAATEVLAVRLMIPLALCFLPAFLVLGVMPVVLALVSSTVSSL